MGKLYIAYGSNINIEQMADRCPTAKVKGKGKIGGWMLAFRGRDGEAFATIEQVENGEVPVLIWEIEPSDEDNLDEYEEYPELYRKEIIPVIYEGNTIEAMVYIMNKGWKMAIPSSDYYDSIKKGYEAVGFEEDLLKEAYFQTTNNK